MNPARRVHGDPALLHSALELASRGWHVFPCAPGTKRPALRGNWQHHATTDPRRIHDWWTYRPYNIAISCDPSGLVVIDLDVPQGASSGTATGASSLAGLCQRTGHPYPSNTFTVITPSGGMHLYFRSPATAIPNSASRLGPSSTPAPQAGTSWRPAAALAAGPTPPPTRCSLLPCRAG